MFTRGDDDQGIRGSIQSSPIQSSSSQNQNPQSHLIQAPSINLPKGGGAIRGIGEKFTTNPVMGTGSMTVPIATSPGRSDFGPKLSLSLTQAPVTGLSGSDGASLCPLSLARQTRDFRSITMQKNLMSLFSLGPKILCRCTVKTKMEMG